MIKKYSIGIDFGTLSGRVLLVDNSNGKEIASAEKAYRHGVIDRYLPDGKTKLGSDWALQHPQDYLDVLRECIPAVLEKANIKPDKVTGVGVDFTSCTMMPVDERFIPLCFNETYKNEPHAYVKLWKHHAAQSEADRITKAAEENGYHLLLQRFGGRVSSEYLLPKIWQILNESPKIYHETYKFIEAADWIVNLLTGSEKRSSCCAGYKGMWSKTDGYPAKDFLRQLDVRLENLVEEKLSREVYPLGYKAGEINDAGEEFTGLKKGTAVAVAVIDAHAAVPAAGIAEPGKMLMILGTSTCHMLLGHEEKMVPGMCGVVADGIVPGYYGYEAGQACGGDHFDWFVKHCVPPVYFEEAKIKGMNIHQLLSQKASEQKAGEHGLLALDWWNGNRSTLMDANLSGLVMGCTLATSPEDIYRALIEATAFGTRVIIDTFENSGVKINEIIASGGVAGKNPFIMQIYADVTNRKIKIAHSPNASALGAAIHGAAAAGKENGGYDSMREAANIMARLMGYSYKPNPKNIDIYKMIFKEYKKLYNYFGKENNVMKVLKTFRKV